MNASQLKVDWAILLRGSCGTKSLISLFITDGKFDLTGVKDGRGWIDLKYGRSLVLTVKGDKVVSRPRATPLEVFLVRLTRVNFDLLV